MIDDEMRQLQTDLDKNVGHLKDEYSRLQIGRASAALVESLQVDAYGVKQPIKALATIVVPDAKTIQIQPWDKSQLGSIEKAIQQSDINISPVNDGINVRLNIPPLTEERRRDLTKVVHRLAEDSRIAVRNLRQKVHDKVKTMEKSGDITEDDARSADKRIQEKVDKVNQQIEEMAKNKENDVMTV
ncbi:ribosome recycling factor [Patescibacteria group bacterium]|nr:ribosome recycling factor [Patescibacteria group bacterium]MBU1703598.1 ribosome recycling factor [Patescibacteria group bacterium]MBU1953571.1 ribosome recycling factor [Patescibacteria group bacterium]